MTPEKEPRYFINIPKSEREYTMPGIKQYPRDGEERIIFEKNQTDRKVIRKPKDFVTNTPKNSPRTILAEILKERGIDVRISNEATDIYGGPLPDFVAIFAEDNVRQIFHEIIASFQFQETRVYVDFEDTDYDLRQKIIHGIEAVVDKKLGPVVQEPQKPYITAREVADLDPYGVRK